MNDGRGLAVERLGHDQKCSGPAYQRKIVMRSIWGDLSGSTVAMFALGLPAVLGAAALAVDYSDAVRTKHFLQSVADTSALRGTKTLAETGGDAAARRIAVQEAVRHYIEAHAPGNTPETSIVLKSEGAAQDAVTVAMTSSKPMMLSGLLGFSSWTLPVSATASYAPTVPACVVALGRSEPVGLDMRGSGQLSAAACSVWSNTAGPNSIASSPSSGIAAARVCAVGAASGNGSRSPAAETGCAPLADPYADRVFPTFSGCDYAHTEVKTNHTLHPGVYCGLTIQGNGIQVKLNPGLYVILNGVLRFSGTATIDGSNGVSFFLAGTSYLEFRGNPSVTVAAMTDGPFAGIAFASDRAGPALESTMLGNGTTVLSATSSGAIYLPNQKLSISGNVTMNLNSKTDRVVARALSFGGSANVNLKSENAALQVGTISNLVLTE